MAPRRLLQVGNTAAGNLVARYAQQARFAVTKLVPSDDAEPVDAAWDTDKQIHRFGGSAKAALAEQPAAYDVLVWDDGYGDIGWLDGTPTGTPLVLELRASNLLPGRWSEDTLLAEAGIAYLTGYSDRPPLPLPGSQAALLLGAHGWAAVAASLFASDAGMPDRHPSHIVIAALEVLANFHQFTLVDFEYNRRIRPRSGTRWSNNHPLCTYPCRDGFVAACITSDDQFSRFLICLDIPEVLSDERFRSGTLRRANADALDELVIPRLMHRTRAEIATIGGERGVPIAPVRSPDEVLEFPLSASRGLWRDVGGIRLPELPRPVERPVTSVAAVRPSTPTERSGELPLAGVRVVAFTKVWAGPLLGRLLGDLSADVVRIEPPFGRGPRTIPAGASTIPSIYPGDDPGARPWNRQGIANVINRHNSCMTLDIKKPTGRELAQQLCTAADIVIENNLPGALRRAGLGYADLAAKNPGLI